MTIRQRPMGVTILALLYLLAGVVWIVGLLTRGGGFGILSIVVGAIPLAIAYGTWTLKPWAWTVGLVLSILSIFSAISSSLRDSAELPSSIVSIAISGLIIWYLNSAPVKAAFGRS